MSQDPAHEIRVARSVLRAIGVHHPGIEKRAPRHADVHVTLDDGALDIEVVDAEPEHAHVRARAHTKFHKRLSEALRTLPPAQQAAFHEVYRGRRIFVNFRDLPAPKQRDHTRLLTWLANHPLRDGVREFAPDYSPGSGASPEALRWVPPLRGIDRISVHQTDPNVAPQFGGIEILTWDAQDVFVTALRRKARNVYESDARLELAVYVADEIPNAFSIERIRKTSDAYLRNSAFTRVWAADDEQAAEIWSR